MFHPTDFDDHGKVNRDDHNRDRLTRFGIVVAAALALGTTAPPGLIASTLDTLFSVAAMISAVLAILRGEAMADDRLTLWDQALAFVLLASIAGLFATTAATGAV